MIAGLIGGATGAAAAWGATPRNFRDDEGMSGYELYGGVALLALGESAGMALGTFVANRGQGHFATAAAASLGGGLLGLIVATAAGKAVGGGAFVAVPLIQIPITISALRR